MRSRRSFGFQEGAAAWQRLLDCIPALKAQFANARAERTFTHMPRLAFRSSAIAGERWALLPSAAGFVDPLLSTGFPLTLLGVTRVAEIIEERVGQREFWSATSGLRTTNRSGIAGDGAAHRSALREHESTLMCLLRSRCSISRQQASPSRREGSGSRSSRPRFFSARIQSSGRLARRSAPAHGRDSLTPKSEALMKRFNAAIEPINVAGLGNTSGATGIRLKPMTC